MLDTLIKQKFTRIIDCLDAEINFDIALLRNALTNGRLISEITLDNIDQEPTLAFSSDLNTYPSSARTHQEASE